VRAEAAIVQAALEAELAQITARSASAQAALSDELSKARADSAVNIASLEAELTRVRADLAIVRASAETTAEDRASVEARLLMALDSLERAQAAASDQEVLRSRLAAALADKQSAQNNVSDQQSKAERQAALLAEARKSLTQQEEKSAEAQRQTALLNQQVAALRTQLGGLQALLDDFQERDAASNVQLQNLGSNLNAALARAASEERKRRLLEEVERKRLEIEAAERAAEAENYKAQAKDLERYRSEFFGRLRDVLGNQEGVRIEGDRFVFSSEVLFPPGGAELSFDGQIEIAKVANILRAVANDIPAEIDWVIRVDGHTDNVPLSGHFKYADNWELSQGRALSVVRYMANSLAIPPDRLSANGFGEYQPVNTDDTAAARAQNRRIELKFTEK
jgi:chemotaxis protein MotB